LILYPFNIFVSSYGIKSNFYLVCTTRFWNNLHHWSWYCVSILHMTHK